MDRVRVRQDNVLVMTRHNYYNFLRNLSRDRS